MTYVYVGSYKGEGISIFRVDAEKEKLELLGHDTHCQSPSFLALHPKLNVLYAADERPDCAVITAYKLNPANGLLELINTVKLSGNGTCHISVLPNGKAIIASNYGSGNLVSCGLDSNGRLKHEISSIWHTGSGPHPQQDSAHFHQAVNAECGILAVDLGTDTICMFDTGENGELQYAPELDVKLDAGQGPRHMLFHPNGCFAYVLTELGNRIYFYKVTDKSFQLICAYSLDVPEPSYSAELMLSKDSMFLYVSVRGYDHIIRFRVGKTGELSQPAIFSCYGAFPRMFAFCEEYVLIANQKSDSLVMMRLNMHTGDLSAPCHTSELSSPCALLPVTVDL